MPPKKKASPPTQAQAQAQQVIINIAEEKKKKRTKRRKPKRAPEPSGYDILRRTVAYQAPMPPEYQRESMGKTYRDLLTTMMAITTERNAKTADQIQLQLPVAQPTRLEQIQQTAETIGAVAGTVGDVGEAVGKVAEGAGAVRAVLADTPFEGQAQAPEVPFMPTRAPEPPARAPLAPSPEPPARAPEPEPPREIVTANQMPTKRWMIDNIVPILREGQKQELLTRRGTYINAQDMYNKIKDFGGYEYELDEGRRARRWGRR